MDKNQRTGLLLLFMLMMVWFYMTAPTKEEIARQQFVQDSIAQAQTIDPGLNQEIVKRKDISPSRANDSLIIAQNQGSFGPFAQSSVGTNQIYKLENDKISISFNSKGGSIASINVKDYKKIVDDENRNEVKQDLFLLEDQKNKSEYILPLRGVGNISTNDLYFLGSNNGNTITFKSAAADGKSIEQIYTVKPGSYEIDYQLKLNGISSLLEPGTDRIKMNYENYLDKIEKNYTFEKYYSTIYFKENGEDSDYCSCRADDENELKKSIDWFSFSNQFFNTTYISKEQGFTNAKFETVMLDDSDENLKLLKSSVAIPIASTNNERISYGIYAGPNHFETLNAYQNGMDEIIPFGRSLFGTINRWIIRPSFNWLSGFIGSKGIVIIVLIFILKMLLYPLMYKMLYSQAKMGALKPELAELKAKHKDDPQKAQMATMSVYREYGVNPLGGCMPMVVQMPIWYALFRFFPASLTFRQESFLWATDLSSYDSIVNLPFTIPAFGAHISLFTILWAISTIAYTYYNSKHLDMSANPAMKYIQYFMPLMFLFFFNNYASGLTCYMFFSNLINVTQMIITKNFVFNEEKIRKELFANKEAIKKNPKKKNGFQQRLEEAMKQQQQIAADQKAKSKNKGRKK